MVIDLLFILLTDEDLAHTDYLFGWIALPIARRRYSSKKIKAPGRLYPGFYARFDFFTAGRHVALIIPQTSDVKPNQKLPAFYFLSCCICILKG